MNDTTTTPTTHRVVFRPAKNGAGVNCRLPNGKIAFPSRFHWNQAAPQAFEIWEVAECGGYPNVGYVKPLHRLAEAPLGQSQRARTATAGLISVVRMARLVSRLLHGSTWRIT